MRFRLTKFFQEKKRFLPKNSPTKSIQCLYHVEYRQSREASNILRVRLDLGRDTFKEGI